MAMTTVLWLMSHLLIWVNTIWHTTPGPRYLQFLSMKIFISKVNFILIIWLAMTSGLILWLKQYPHLTHYPSPFLCSLPWNQASVCVWLQSHTWCFVVLLGYCGYCLVPALSTALHLNHNHGASSEASYEFYSYCIAKCPRKLLTLSQKLKIIRKKEDSVSWHHCSQVQPSILHYL